MKYFPRRLLAGILDQLLLSAFALGYVYGFGEVGKEGFIQMNGLLYVLIVISVWVIYFPVIEGLSGYTLFKYIFDVRVVSQSGMKNTISKSLIRHLFDAVDFCFGLGLFVTLRQKDYKRIGDIVARTKVISAVVEEAVQEVTPTVEVHPVARALPILSRPFLLRRMTAFLIDYVALFTVGFVIAHFFGTEMPDGSKELTGATGLLVLPVAWLVIIVIPEGYFGYTLGKGAVSLRVIGDDPGRNRFIISFVRHLFDLMEFCMAGGLVSALLIKLTPEHKRIADFIAGSRVVYDNRD